MSPSSPQKIVFLFRELAGYFVACLEEFVSTRDVEVTVVYWPLNAEAPFQWSESNSKIKWVDRNDWKFEETIEKNKWGEFDLIVVSGWGDEEYNKVVASKGRAKKAITFDTQWDESWRMKLGKWWLWWKVLRHFDFAWVPGDRQKLFAQKLFFKLNQILTGFYVADRAGILPVDRDDSTDAFTIGIVARLVNSKGFPEVIEAMIPALNEHEKWQLAIWGTGPLLETLPQHPQVVYHGFTQPESLKKVWSDLDVFILPSKYEPWGVVVHEAASAGLPLVVTTAVGAGDQFIQSSVNGFIFPVGDYAAMQEGLKNIQHWSREEKRNAKEISLKLAAQISQVQWSENLDKMSKR